MRIVLTLVLAFTLSSAAYASVEPARPIKRIDVEMPIAASDIFVEMISESSPLIPYSLKLWRFQKLLSLIMLGTKAPTWDINFPRSLKALRFNSEMLQEMNPGSDIEQNICALCNVPRRAR